MKIILFLVQNGEMNRQKVFVIKYVLEEGYFHEPCSFVIIKSMDFHFMDARSWEFKLS